MAQTQSFLSSTKIRALLVIFLIGSLGLGFSSAQAAHGSPTVKVSQVNLSSCSNVRMGGTLTFGIPQDVIGFDPTNTQDVTSLSVQLQMFDQLLRYPPNSKKLTGDLATSWSVSKN